MKNRWARVIHAVFVSSGIFLAMVPAQGVVAQSFVSSEALEKRIDAIMSGMTLEQKVGQMVQGNIPHVSPEDVARYHLGSVLNGGGTSPTGKKGAAVSDWLNSADGYYRASLNMRFGGAGIPIIWGTDAVHGHNNVVGATLFPHNIGLGATHDIALVEAIGAATAREVAVTGLDWVFAPTVAVAKDDRWGRTYESFSDDPDLVAQYGAAMVTGLQGTHGEWSGPGKVIATAKHFVGDGGTFRGKDQGDTRLDKATLMQLHGAGYPPAIKAGVQTVMATFNSWNGAKVHGNKELLTDVLKGDLGFDGFVIGDWNGHGQVKGCSDQSCPQAINAGIDMMMVPEKWKRFLENTLRQVRAGTIPEARVNDAVRRILRVKLRMGLFSKGAPSTRPLAGNTSILGAPKHRELARRAVRQSLVLLKNNNAVLPLKKRQKVLVGGDGADNIGKQSGGWTLTWQGTQNTHEDFPGATSIYAGLKEAIEEVDGSVELTQTDEWTQRPDVAVVVFGEDPYAEGSGDRADLTFKDANRTNQALIEKLRAENIPVVSIFLTGRPMYTNTQINQSEAFVVAWLPGSEGAGIADVLVADQTGAPRFDFSGRLAFDWPNSPVNEFNANLPVQAILFERDYGLDYQQEKINLSSDLTELSVEDDMLAPQVVFSGTTRSPFSAYVGDARDWGVLVSGPLTETLGGGLAVSSVDGMLQEDSRRIEWKGAGESQFYWKASSTVDWRQYLQNDAALAMTFRVDKHPEGRVTQRIDCGYPCTGTVPMTRFFKAIPEGRWVRVGIPLRCFAEAGVDFSRITSPLVLLADKPFTVTIKDLRVSNDLTAAALVACK